MDDLLVRGGLVVDGTGAAARAAGARRLRRPAGGYRYTVVAGAVVQQDGELTGARPGTVLRPGR